VETPTSSTTEDFERHRGRLFGLAYRMLGTRAEAEDVVQEAWLRWHQSDRAAVRNPEAWLVTTATRLAIDRLRALRSERDAYQGPWLPEPLLAAAPPSPDARLQLASDLSTAFLVLLERLAPEERAAFLLHDVFECDYADIAATLARSQATVRQMVHRARERVRGHRKRFDVSEGDRLDLLHRFRAAIDAGDEEQLLRLFTPDATWTADGGGVVPAAARPLEGAPRIARFIIGLRRGPYARGMDIRTTTINGEAGLTMFVEGKVLATLAVDIDDDRISRVYAVINPHKLPALPVDG
jgi:RNA polymerase sigma-70 factor, ECF subfamily